MEMKTIESQQASSPSKAQLRHLLEFLEDQPTDLRPAVRWLMLGQPIAENLLPEFAKEPTLEQLLTLMRWVRDQEPELLDVFTSLVATSSHAERLGTETQLDALVNLPPSAWKHPAQVLERPRKPFGELLASCEWRLEGVGGTHDKRRLRSVARKLRKVIELETRAKRRREQIRLERNPWKLHKESPGDEPRSHSQTFENPNMPLARLSGGAADEPPARHALADDGSSAIGVSFRG